VKVLLLKGLFAGFQIFDENAIDGTVNGVANTTITTGRALRRIQTGQLQLYGLSMGIGILAITLALYLFG
jgi:NADH-quinone oxidoreductase subunit L